MNTKTKKILANILISLPICVCIVATFSGTTLGYCLGILAILGIIGIIMLNKLY